MQWDAGRWGPLWGRVVGRMLTSEQEDLRTRHWAPLPTLSCLGPPEPPSPTPQVPQGDGPSRAQGNQPVPPVHEA